MPQTDRLAETPTLVFQNVRMLEMAKAPLQTQPLLVTISAHSIEEGHAILPDGNRYPRVQFSFETQLGRITFLYTAQAWRVLMTDIEASGAMDILELQQ